MSYTQTLEVIAPAPTQSTPRTKAAPLSTHSHEQTKIIYLDRAKAHPFLKWAGGKRALVGEIAQMLPPGGFRDYYEPFLGGGAVFFGLGSRRTQRSYLSDINENLMRCWQMIQTHTEDVITELKQHAKKHCKQHYLHTRAADDIVYPVALAARFIYLNKTCFNGLYRVNKRGIFNVPMGKYNNPLICDANNLRAAALALERTTLRSCSFSTISPSRGDLVYCDPPYDGTFTGYSVGGFTEDDQKLLRDAALGWAEAGAHVIVSNSDTPLIRRLWADWKLKVVVAPRSISCTAAKRGKVGELLISST